MSAPNNFGESTASRTTRNSGAMTTSSVNKPISGKNDSLDEEKIRDHWKTAKKFPVRTRNLLTSDIMLPSAIPDARISQYVVYRESTTDVQNNLNSTYKDFIPSLNAKRESCLNQSIIFIGHTFGGIFMEKVWLQKPRKIYCLYRNASPALYSYQLRSSVQMMHNLFSFTNIKIHLTCHVLPPR